jgi:hypothetical protein
MKTPTHPTDLAALREIIRDLQQRVAALESGAPDYWQVFGPRADLAEGDGRRVRVGLLSDGTYGVERWNGTTGVRTVPSWV